MGEETVMRYEAPVAAASSPPAPRLVPLAELTEMQCRYPVLAAPNAPGKFLFCGLPTALGKTFCPYHHRLCWHPRNAPRPIHAEAVGNLTKFYVRRRRRHG
ncbi:hypothetical protein I6F26_10395 [Ensifer sp. IC3342]|nr:hypothetical protein [Ensifer sp. BRP08]MCA1446988.1 hypothetical protein [Ensifer sp. IC3342]